MSVSTPQTFIDLLQRLWMECGLASSALPTTCQSPGAGELGRMVNYVNNGWLTIQRKREDWGFQRKTFTFAGNSGDNSQNGYTPLQAGIAAGTFGDWAKESFRNYVTTIGPTSEVYMDHIVSYDSWRDTYLYGANRSVRTRPIEWAINPANKAIMPGPISDGTYTFIGEYFQSAQPLVADADVPAIYSIDAQYNMLIVFEAMKSYGAYEAAPEVYQMGDKEFTLLYRKLLKNKLPPLRRAGCIA